MMTTFHAAFHVLTASFVAPAARPTAPRVLAPPLMMALDASPFTFDGTSSVNGWHPQDRMMAPQGRFSPHEFSPHDMDMEMGSHMHYGRGRHMMPSLPHDMGGRYHQPPPYAMGGQYSPYDDTRMRMHMGGRHQQFGRERRMGYPRDRSGRMGASGEAPFTFDGTSSTAAWSLAVSVTACSEPLRRDPGRQGALDPRARKSATAQEASQVQAAPTTPNKI